MHKVLAAERLAPEIPAEADIYGWLIGSWKLKILKYAGVDLASRNIMGEVHFGRVLEGRAIQDVWIAPERMFGSTIRSWDPAIAAWRITWINPLRSHYEQQIGRRIGAEIVQLGARPDGTATKWRFTEITNDSFRWIGEALTHDGVTWKTEGEFLATREK